MEEKELSKKFLQSYVYSEKHGNFFVSTCYRQSSAAVNSPPWFYETFAWKLDSEDKRTDWVADNSGSRYKRKAYEQHIEVCKQLDETGKFDIIEEQDD